MYKRKKFHKLQHYPLKINLLITGNSNPKLVLGSPTPHSTDFRLNFFNLGSIHFLPKLNPTWLFHMS